MTNNSDQNIAKLKLSVQISLTGLSFLIINKQTKEVLFFSEINFDSVKTPEELLIEIKSIISKNGNLLQTCKDVLVLYETKLYTLVPTPLFQENKASEYLKFNSKILANDFIAHDTIQEHNITTVYIPFANINNYFFEQFGNFNYYHSSTKLLNYFLEVEKKSLTTKVIIHQINGQYELIIIKKGKLLLCNTFVYKTPEDFIYYILFCFEQLKVDPNTVNVTLCGAITKEDAFYQIAYKYIRNISFLTNFNSHIKLYETNFPHQNFLLKISI